MSERDERDLIPEPAWNSQSKTILRRLKRSGVDISAYDSFINGDRPDNVSLTSTWGEVRALELITKFQSPGSIRHGNHVDFFTDGGSYEVWSPYKSSRDRSLLNLAFAISELLLRDEGHFTKAVYSKASSNPLTRFDSQNVSGRLKSGGQVLIDNTATARQLIAPIFRKVREKRSKITQETSHATIVINVENLLSTPNPQQLANLLRQEFKPSDAAIDGIILASLGEGKGLHVVVAPNKYSRSPINEKEFGHSVFSESMFPFGFCFPLRIQHDAGWTNMIERTKDGQVIVAGNELKDLFVGESVTAIKGAAIGENSSIKQMTVKAGARGRKVPLGFRERF